MIMFTCSEDYWSYALYWDWKYYPYIPLTNDSGLIAHFKVLYLLLTDDTGTIPHFKALHHLIPGGRRLHPRYGTLRASHKVLRQEVRMQTHPERHMQGHEILRFTASLRAVFLFWLFKCLDIFWERHS